MAALGLRFFRNVFALTLVLAAAVVLITSDRSKARAAIVQGLFPAIALVALLVHVLG